MPLWNSDASTNHLKNTYFQDINQSGFAVDISGNLIVRNEYSLQFDNMKNGSFIGLDISSDYIDGSTNYNFGSHLQFDRFKQWQMSSDTSFVNINSIAAGSNIFVASNNDALIVSKNGGYTWDSIYDLSYSDYKIGFKKVRLFKENGANITFNEIQIWMNLSGVATNIIANTTSTFSNNNLQDRDSSGVLNVYDSSQNIEIVLDDVYQSADLLSVVLYSRKSQVDLMVGLQIELKDSNDLVFASDIIESANDYYRFDGPAFHTFSGDDLLKGQSITGIIDASYVYSFNKVRLKRSYNGSDFAAQELQVWVGGSDNTLNSTQIGGIRFKYIGDVSGQNIRATELQMWVDGSNKLTTSTLSASKIDRYTLINVIDNNFNEDNGISIVPDESNTELFFQVDFSNNPVMYSDIQSIVLYNLYQPTTLENVQMQLLDTSDKVFYSHNFDASFLNYNIYRFDGLDINNYAGGFSSQPSSTQIYQYNAIDNSFTSDDDASTKTITLDAVIIPSTNYNIQNLAISNTFQTGIINDNYFDSDVTIGATNYDDIIDICFNSSISIENLKTIVLYTLDNANSGIKIQLFEDDVLHYEYEIYDDISGSKAYRFNGLTGIEDNELFEDINNVINYPASYNIGQQRIIDGTSCFNIDLVADISKNEVDPSVNFWNSINDVIFAPDEDRFMAVGNKVVAYSNDGYNWTAISFDLANDGLEETFSSVAYGNNKFVIVANNANDVDPLPKYSIDGGNTWETYGAPLFNIDEIVINGFMYNGTFYGGLEWNKINYVDGDGSWNVFNYTEIISNDEYQAGIREANWSQIEFGNGVFVTISSIGSKRIMYINDSVNNGFWNLIDTSGNAVLHNEWKSIAFGAGRFVIISSVGTTRLIHSINGAQWSNDGVVGLINKSWNSVDFVNNHFILLSSSDIAVSLDGLSWKMYSLYYLENINWQNVAYLQNNYVCCGNNGDIGKNFLMNNGIVKNAVCLGNYGSVDFDNSVAIGAGASCNAPNQIALGAPGTTVRVFDSIISQY